MKWREAFLQTARCDPQDPRPACSRQLFLFSPFAMNDDTELMPPPPPRGFKRHKTLAPSNVEKAESITQQHQAASVLPMMDNDSALISVDPRHNYNYSAVGGMDGSEIGLTFDRETKNYANSGESMLGYSLTNDVRPGAVSPEEGEPGSVPVECGALASVRLDGSFIQESTYYESQDEEKAVLSSYDDCLTINRSDNSIIVSSSNHQSSSNMPFESTGRSKLHQKVSDIGSTHQYRSMKRKQSQMCDSPTIVNVSFRDIIGHGQAKLRLDEALLPLALPSDLADSVLTGACMQTQLPY